MHYGDNPLRPELHFWFGPLTMVDFLGNYNLWYNVSPSCSRYCWWPGTCHESPMYACKLGIQAALTDIQNNHPNDLVSLIMFSVPLVVVQRQRRYALQSRARRAEPQLLEHERFALVSAGDDRQFQRHGHALRLQQPGSAAGDGRHLLRHGPDAGLSTSSARNSSLLTYNSGQPAGDAGGNGRKGAQKIIIFETDGARTRPPPPRFNNSGAYNSYYKVRYNYGNPGGQRISHRHQRLHRQRLDRGHPDQQPLHAIGRLDTASPPGYSTASKTLLIHCIGFGPEFAPSSGTAAANTATLNAMQTIGNVTDGMPSYKIIYGNQASIVSDLQQAFTKILQSGVQVSLIQ